MSAPPVNNPLQRLQEANELRERANAAEREAVQAALGLVGGNVRQAADILAMPHRTLDSWLRGGKHAALHAQTLRKPGRPVQNVEAPAKPAKAKKKGSGLPPIPPWVKAGFATRAEYRESKKKVAK